MVFCVLVFVFVLLFFFFFFPFFFCCTLCFFLLFFFFFFLLCVFFFARNPTSFTDKSFPCRCSPYPSLSSPPPIDRGSPSSAPPRSFRCADFYFFYRPFVTITTTPSSLSIPPLHSYQMYVLLIFLLLFCGRRYFRLFLIFLPVVAVAEFPSLPLFFSFCSVRSYG